jgi:hypothetical protein
VHRLDVDESADLVLVDPAKERARGPVIGLARVAVADRRGEELEEPPRGVIAGASDHGRHRERGAQRRRLHRRRGLDDRRQIAPLGAHDDTL